MREKDNQGDILKNNDPNYLTRGADFIKCITDLVADIMKVSVWLLDQDLASILTDKKVAFFTKVTIIDNATLLLD